MHGVTGKSDAALGSAAPTSKVMLLLLVTMTGVNGEPVENVSMLFNCQPPITPWVKP